VRAYEFRLGWVTNWDEGRRTERPRVRLGWMNILIETEAGDFFSQIGRC
jgi:hypothetical protein